MALWVGGVCLLLLEEEERVLCMNERCVCGRGGRWLYNTSRAYGLLHSSRGIYLTYVRKAWRVSMAILVSHGLCELLEDGMYRF